MRILVADDPKLVRQAIIGLPAEQNDCHVCGEAADSLEALKKAVELRPDLILPDVSMPGKSGLETTGLIKQQLPEVKILIITQHDAKQLLGHSLRIGADGCIDKARLSSDLLPAIRSLQRTCVGGGE